MKRKHKYCICMAVLLSLVMSVAGGVPSGKTMVPLAKAAFDMQVEEKEWIPDKECWKYEKNEDGTIRITSFEDSYTYDEWNDRYKEAYSLTVPSELDGKKVTHIGGGTDNNFWHAEKRITSLKIPQGVKEISNISDEDLVSVELPSSLEYIGDDAFTEAKTLKQVSIPDTANLTEIGSSAFYNCENLESINFPENLKRISAFAFYNCKRLASVDFPKSLSYIDMQAFYGCYALKSVALPANVSTIGLGAFTDCRGMESYYVASGNEKYYAENGILYERWMDEEPVYGDGLDEDGNPIVESWREVEKKYLLSYPCAKKGEVNLDADTSFEWTAFINAKGLTGIHIDSQDPDYTSVDGVVYTKDMKGLCICPAGKTGEFTVPEGVYYLQTNSFSNSELTALHLPDSLCGNYKDEFIGETEGFIGFYSFYQCESLQTITLGANIHEKDVLTIMKSAVNLKNIQISEDNPEVCTVDNTLYDKALKTLLYIPAALTGKLSLPDSVETSGINVGGEKITELNFGKNYRVTVKTEYDDVKEDDDGNIIEKGEALYDYAAGLPNLPSLQAYSVSPENKSLSVYEGILYSGDGKVLYHCPAAKRESMITMPSGTTTIFYPSFCDYVEYHHDNMPEETLVFTIPASVTDIAWEDSQFYNLIIKGFPGSAAEEYVKKAEKANQNVTFVALNDSKPAKTEQPSQKPVITPSAKPSVTAHPVTDTPILKEDSSLKMTETGYLVGLIQNQNTVEKICQQVDAEDIVIKDIQGKTLTDMDLVGTGATLSVMDGGKVQASCQVVLTGDINGEGKVNAKDVSLLARSLVGKTTLGDSQLAAAEIRKDGKVNGMDVSMLARSLVGKSTIASQAK